jgi:phosphoserine aminotransferase
MANRVYNFNPGPSTLPLSVLEKMASEMYDYNCTGMSVLETSHRSPEFKEIHAETKELVKEIAGLSDDYHILFAGGGASLQFAMIPLNFLRDGKSADYVNTGTWSKKAIKEAKIVGNINVAGTRTRTSTTYPRTSTSIRMPAMST